MGTLEQIDAYRWRVPQRGGMRVPGLIYASEALVADIQQDKSVEQVQNVAHLPGIVGHAIAMPDMHWGYGFPIGGVAAFDEAEGVLSPGGVGYDINCGVRLISTHLSRNDVLKHVEALSLALYNAIPAGVGTRAAHALSKRELDGVLRQGAAWAVHSGYGRNVDLDVTEEHGCMHNADPEKVSERALERGRGQLGSLGSGNHFCELGFVEKVYDPVAAAAYGLAEGGITILLHSGSRGFGYQVCDDALHAMLEASQRYGINPPDRQLCAAPLQSPEAKSYFGAMGCAINYAFANRQMMTHLVRQALVQFFRDSEEGLGLSLVYDVCHNIAKWETHTVNGQEKRLCVHRKGATRALAANHPLVPERYRAVGQPVLIPGDMGRYSYVLAGAATAGDETFASSCHGAGRRLSRHAAKRAAKGRSIFREMEKRGIYVRSDNARTVAEEISEAYKDVAGVIDVVCGAGLAKRVAKLVPMAVIKG